MNWLTRWFINNSVGANLLMLAIIASGILSFQHLRIESFPQVAPSSIEVTVAYPGGTAKQVDESITQRIEAAVSGIAGIKQITSESNPGRASVRIQKKTESKLDRLIEDVRNQVNSIVGFPVQAEKPQIVREEFTNLAAFVIISGPREDKTLQPIAKQIKQALEQHPDIAKVTNWGSRQPQLIIEPNISKLRSLGLSLEDIANKIEQMSFEARSGELKSDKGRITLRGDGYANDLQKLSQLEIISGPSGNITLSELATLTRGYESTGSIVRNNGETAIALRISTSQKDNLFHVSKAIKETLAQQRLRLPSDIHLSTMADMAPYIDEQLTRLGNNAWQGLIIVLVLLGLFLELKLAFWVATGIPVALCGTLSAMNIVDYSINDITLFGFILVLGILVDDAVVVGESIHSERTLNTFAKEAAWQGVRSVSVATVFGVLTTIAAFSPMLWINNDLAKVLAGFSAVVIFALLFSLIESKFILPAHLAGMKPTTKQPNFISILQHYAQTGLSRFNHNIYKPILIWAIRNKAATLITFTAFIVLAYGLWSTGVIRSSVFPEIPGRYISAKIDLEDGAPLPLQENALSKLESTALAINRKLAHQYQLEQTPLSNFLIWSDGYGAIEVSAELTTEALTQLPGNTILDQWREQLGTIEGAYSVQLSAADEPAGGTMISLSASDRELAKQAAKYLSSHLSTLPGVSDVFDDGKGGQEQVIIKLNEYGRQLGLTQDKIGKLAGDAFGQREIGRILDQGQETKILIRYSKNERLNTEQLKSTPLIINNGKSVLLSEVANLTFKREAESLFRRNREQVVNVYWYQNRDIQSPEQTLQQLTTTLNNIEKRYPGVKAKATGEFEEINDVQQGFKSAMILTLLLIYILLAVPLQSYWQPFIIMAVIPFGFAGAILGHYVMGLPISLLSMFGMMAMTGIVINDSLVLITQFNRLRKSNMPLHEALIKTGTSRMRAIFLTTITTVCGLIPLLSESAEQAQYLKPAAVSLVFGELFATCITLILIPVLLGGVTRAPTSSQTKSITA